jgi:DNA-binding NarL/FixJ family response regulator
MDDCGVILVVDSDRRSRLRLELMLRPMGLEVASVADAASALELAYARRPTLAIVDVELTDISGLALLARLLEIHGADFPVLLTSGERTSPQDRAAGLLLGAEDYLVKPLDSTEVVARVRRTLRRSIPPTSTFPAEVWNARGRLSARERQILRLLAEGNTQRRIAEVLVISPKTVGTHIQHVLSKLGVHTRAHAVAEAYRLELVNGDYEPTEVLGLEG